MYMGDSMKDDLKNESDKLLNEIKQASMQCLELDDDSSEIETENREILQADIKKFTQLVKRLIKQNEELKKIEDNNKDNEILNKYIKVLNKIKETQIDIDNAKKGYLYESAIKLPENQFENDILKITVIKPYTRINFNKDKFIKDYAPDSKMYKKYIKETTIKGNVQYTIKDK